MRIRKGRAAIAVAAGVFMSLVAGLNTAAAPAAKQQKPARIVADAEIVWINTCPWYGNQYGHLEINGFDDDPTVVVDSADLGESQNDRLAIRITWADGTTWTPDALGLYVNPEGDTAHIAIGTWWSSGFYLHDRGNPGAASSGDSHETVDWGSFMAVASTCDASLYLTSGNINITPASP